MLAYTRGLVLRSGACYVASWIVYGALVGVAALIEWQFDVPYATASVAVGGFFATYAVAAIPLIWDICSKVRKWRPRT
jgi:alpha-galactosidase/6-phospho-beta-glucosidase family protein